MPKIFLIDEAPTSGNFMSETAETAAAAPAAVYTATH